MDVTLRVVTTTSSGLESRFHYWSRLPNDNFDTGAITGPGIYRLNDETHSKLLDALAKQNFSRASLEVRAELLEFYGHPDAPYATKRKSKDWAKVQAELEQLKKATRWWFRRQSATTASRR